MPLTPEQHAELQAVNSRFNAIPYDDLPKAGEGPDVWKAAPDGGTYVCRDYVLAKLAVLTDWPAAALSVVECWTDPPAATRHSSSADGSGGGMQFPAMR